MIHGTAIPVLVHGTGRGGTGVLQVNTKSEHTHHRSRNREQCNQYTKQAHTSLTVPRRKGQHAARERGLKLLPMQALRNIGLIQFVGLAGLVAMQVDASAQVRPTKRLPPRAVIHMEGRWLGEVHPVERRECRSVFRIHAAEVRRYFDRWVEVDATQYDLGPYVTLQCGRSGTAQLDGKTYTWAVQPENTMTTSWPDGKMHWYVPRILKGED